jgi:flagellar hook-associated protein FlgK
MSMKGRGTGHHDPPPDVHDNRTGEIRGQRYLQLADLQFEKQKLPVWTFERGKEAFSKSMEASTEGYYQGLIGSMGTKASSIERGLEFSSSMVEKLNEQRDALSGVSLDEEMMNMMKYQQSYTAASKLLKTSDEMLQTILSIK